MAPNIDREAEHLKDKARKDLLALLENVRTPKARNSIVYADIPRSEERRMWFLAKSSLVLSVSLLVSRY